MLGFLADCDVASCVGGGGNMETCCKRLAFAGISVPSTSEDCGREGGRGGEEGRRAGGCPVLVVQWYNTTSSTQEP